MSCRERQAETHCDALRQKMRRRLARGGIADGWRRAQAVEQRRVRCPRGVGLPRAYLALAAAHLADAAQVPSVVCPCETHASVAAHLSSRRDQAASRVV